MKNKDTAIAKCATGIEKNIEKRTADIHKHAEELADRIQANPSVAELINHRETAMRQVCFVISCISLVIEILFYIAASYGIVGGICMKAGWSDRYVVWRANAADGGLNMLMPGNQRVWNSPRIAPIDKIFIFHIGMFFMCAQWGVIIGCIRHIFSNISKGMRPFEKENIRWLIVSACLVFFSGIVQPLFFLLLLLLVALILIFQYGNVLQQKADSTINDQENIIFSLAEITEAKSGQTGQHVKRVSEYSRVLAEGMGLSPAKTEEIRLASVLHDVGKLMIDTKILDKPGKLTDEEYAIIKTHVDYGEKLLESVDGNVLSTAKVIARDHHERWDGRGYTHGAGGEGVSLEGRIVAVADVFDALTSKRSYKDAWDAGEAYNEIVKNSGTQFDPQVVEVFKERFPEIEEIAQKYR